MEESGATGVEGGKGCSSPPCMLHEVDPAFAGLAEQKSTLANCPPGSAGQDWEEIRLWRKTKRALLIERRLAIPMAQRMAHNEAITAVLAQILSPRHDALIGFYWPFRGEYDARPLVRSLYAQGVRFALPVVVAKAQPLVFRPWYPGVAMVPGVWNIPVPAEGDAVLPEALLVPLVGFDQQGYRLGYGGGFYDRTVAAMAAKPLLVGIGYESSRIPTIHPKSHDIRMDLVVTERGVGT